MGISEHRSAERIRWIALAVVCLAQLMSIVDVSIVNVALPSIQRSLHFASSDLTWVPNGYLITFGSLLLLGGRVGDLIGRRQMFLVGVAVFTAASALCGLAESQTVLIVARLIQGAGGAAASSAIMAIITTEFPEPRERARAMSIYMLIISAGGSIGLLAGGVITQLLNWHWIFFVNVPFGIATLVLGRLWIADKPGIGVGRNLDIAGPVLVTAGMVAAGVRRRGGRDAGRLRHRRGATPGSDHAAADLRDPRHRRLERRSRPADGRDVLDVLHRRAVSAARARLRHA
jgi:MFS family permease